MTKRIGPEQKKILTNVERARVKVDKTKAAYEAALGELHDWVRTGFVNDISGIKLSEKSKLSLPRVYQVRDEEPVAQKG